MPELGDGAGRPRAGGGQPAVSPQPLAAGGASAVCRSVDARSAPEGGSRPCISPAADGLVGDRALARARAGSPQGGRGPGPSGRPLPGDSQPPRVLSIFCQQRVEGLGTPVPGPSPGAGAPTWHPGQRAFRAHSRGSWVKMRFHPSVWGVGVGEAGRLGKPGWKFG